MNINNKEKKPYNPIEELIKISEESINNLDKKNKIIKVRATIIMCSTMILSFTILRPIITFSLIGSSLINLVQAYTLKRQINNIKERKKAIRQINKYLNLEKKLNRKHKTILNNFIFNAEHRNDLYECIWTNNIEYLQNITKKYETKFKDDLNILSKINKPIKNSNETAKVISNNTTTPNIYNGLTTAQQYYKPNSQINGYQYVKAYRKNNERRNI